MYAADAEPTRDLARSIWSFVQLGVLAVLVGWLAERLLDPGLRIRGIAFLAGIAGFYAGPRLWAAMDLANGPTLGGYAVLPAFAGALGVCALLRLVSLGAQGPRW